MFWEIVSFIEAYTLGINFLAFVVYLTMVRKKTGFVFIVAGLILLDLCHQWIRYYLGQFFEVEEYYQVVVAAWYLSYAVTDFLFVWGMLKYVNLKGLARDRASDVALFGIGVMGLLQVIRYAERMLAGTKYTNSVYELGIPLINVSISIVLAMFALRAFIVVSGSRLSFILER